MKNKVLPLFIAFSAAFSTSAMAADAPAVKQDVTCPNAGGISKMLTGICYSCTLPIRIFGATLGKGKDKDIPDDANKSINCACSDDANKLAPKFGMAMGSWQPAYYFEITDAPYCFSSLEGLSLNSFGSLQRGHVSQQDPLNTETSESQAKKFQYHMISFPLPVLLDLLVDNTCNPGGYMDIDILQMSELDPLFSISELGVFSPEGILYGSPPAQLMCGAEVATGATQPIDALPQCAGTWGVNYPQSGYSIHGGSEVALESLTMSRAIAMNHKRGVLQRTVGADTLCETVYEPLIKKTQYRIQHFYPHNQASDFHLIGEHTLLWGEWRTTQTNNTYINLLYNYRDCCLLNQ